MFKTVILNFVSDEIDNWFFVSVEIETIHNNIPPTSNDNIMRTQIFNYSPHSNLPSAVPVAVVGDRVVSAARALYTAFLGVRFTQNNYI